MTRQIPDDTSLRFRRPREADHAAIVRLVDDWWGERRIHVLLPRLWFQHFSGTSWLAEIPQAEEEAEGSSGRPVLAGFLVGFVSPDHPGDGYIHLVATSPNHRRRGIGRALYERFFDDAAGRGVRRITAVTWPGNRVAVEFHRAIGFRAVDGPGTQNLYGIAAFPDYEYEREDRTVFVVDLGPSSRHDRQGADSSSSIGRP